MAGRAVVIPLVDKYGAQRSADEARIIKEMLDEDVERFVQHNRIDAPAARDLRSEPLEVQLAVLDRGPLSVCVNPSAALIGRIRDAKRGVLDQRSGLGLGLGASAPVPVQGSTEPAAAVMGSGPLSEVDRFIVENRLDQGAMMSFRAEPPDVQRAVIAQGPLFNCSNPSAALMGRIRGARLGIQTHFPGGPLASPGGGPAPGSAEANLEAPGGAKEPSGPQINNIEDSRLNEEALKAIQQLNAEQREPDAGLKTGEPTPPGRTRTGPAGREEVDQFIRDNRLDDRAAQSLRLETTDVQTVVLERGSLLDSINPSAALMGRIAQAKLSAANGAAAAGAPAALGGVARLERATPEDVDRFLSDNRIDERAAREFRVEIMDVQTAVINRGPLTNCTNPSSALLGRIRDAKRFSSMAGFAAMASAPVLATRSSPF